jgi:phosphocarrier protein
MPKVETRVVLQNKLGLHARPSGQIAATAGRFAATIRLGRDGMLVNAKSVIELLLLAAPHGTVLDLIADGADAQEAVSAIEQLFLSRFGHLEVDG